MKRFFLLTSLFLLLSSFCFAQDNSEENDEDTEVQTIAYLTNGRGDQYIKIGIMVNFPLNFDDKLYIGGAAEIGYYRFFTSWFAIGGELGVGYNPTLGSNVFTFVHLTVGVVFQPSIWRFEIPITLTVGGAFETCQNKKYFPGFAAKAELGVFFRINEGWSVGLGSNFLYLPEWHTTTENAVSDYGLFITAFAAVRYHF